MKFIKVDSVPETRNKRRLREDWEEFMSMNTKVAKVDLSQYSYKSFETAVTSMSVSVKRWAYPIAVMQRNGEIFLVRKDI